MCDMQKMVTFEFTENYIKENENDNEDELDTIKLQNRLKGRSRFSNFIRFVIIYILDYLLLIALLPFMLWQSVSSNEHLMIILKAVVEVTLELILWIIFAGVSLLLTATFVLEDIYFRKTDSNKVRQLLKSHNESPLKMYDKNVADAERQNSFKEKENLEVAGSSKPFLP